METDDAYESGFQAIQVESLPVQNESENNRQSQAQRQSGEWLTMTEVVVHSEDTDISNLCCTLKIPSNISNLATDFWRKLRLDNPEDFQGKGVTWYICLLYIASIDTRLPYGVMDPQAQCGALEYPSVTVTQLLRAADISIIEFFRKLTEITRHSHVSDAVLHHQMSLQRKYLITFPLFHKFKIMFDEIFLREVHPFAEESDIGGVDVDVDSYRDRKTLCWALFVYIKGTTLSGAPELLQSFHLLLCCVLHVMSVTPLFQLKPPYGGVKLDSTEEENGLVAALCDNYHVCPEEVKSLQASHVTPVIDSIEQQHGIVTVDVVVKLCQLQYRQLGDIDEMLFLDEDAQLMTTAPGTEGTETTSHGNHSNSSANQTHVTPVRAAVTSVRQLKTLLSAMSTEPSPDLRQHFTGCVLDPSRAVEQRVSELGDTFVTRWTQTQGDASQHMARQRWQLAVRLYYLVLEKLLTQEKSWVPQQDLSRLLLNAVFHKCLLVCAVEIVMATYRTPWVSLLPEENYTSSEDCEGVVFPWILTVFDVTPFDVIKVLESFVTAEPSFSKDIVKHLQHIENRILDSLAWKAGSPLFDQLIRCEVSLLPITPPSERGHGETYVCPSPVRFRSGVSLLHGMSPSTTPDTSPVSPRHRARSTSLNMFFNKVCRLAHHRMLALCGLLAIPKDVQVRVWTCLECCITRKAELLKDRHLDQIVMCSIYAVCKVAYKEVKFKTIVAMYRTLLHAGHHVHRVYKQVLVMPGEFDTIISFYNRVFMPALKSHILQCSTLKPGLSPHAATSGLLNASPIYELPGRKNFYISPMKESPFQVPQSPSQLTPNSAKLYCTVGDRIGSAEKFRQINQFIRLSSPGVSRTRGGTGGVTHPRSQKRLQFEEPVDSTTAPDSVDNAQFEQPIVVKRMRGGNTINKRKSLQFEPPPSPSSQ